MSNFRRSGGNMGGGNRNSYQQPFQSNVSPWQGASSMNMNPGGSFLSQLSTNPQQLALALSTLLQPQVQAPPSLMSMNNSNNSMNRGGNYDRFNNRGRDNRRHEPYNKNRGGSLNNRDNRNRNQVGGRNNRRDDKKKDDKDEKKEGKKVVKKEKESKTDADQSMDEEEKKRDWKDEKKSADDDDEEGSEKNDDEDTGKKRNKEGKFFGVSPQYLTCFVCNKQMWDGESMEKHLRGRAHSEMIKALEESIGITVGILRENMRLTEERNIIEMYRIQRTKKFNKFRGPEESCNMCDLRFRGKMSSHRRSEGHQRLKRYLHPKCNICDTEFHARIEWIEHRMTPEHLRKHSEKLEEFAETGKYGSDGATVITNVAEQDSQEIDLDKLLIEPLQMESDNPITELDDSLENMQNRYPAYKSDRQLAAKALKEFTGFLCELCNKSFTNEEDAKSHLTTPRHYYKFIKALKEKWDEKDKREKEERAEAKRKEKEEKENAENAENGEEEGEEEADQEMDESLNDSAMETADETLNSTQEEETTMEELQEVQEGDEVEEEDEEKVLEEEEVKEEIVEVKQEKVTPKKAAPASKPGPASKKAAPAVNKPGPASTKNATNASPGPRSRKGQ